MAERVTNKSVTDGVSIAFVGDLILGVDDVRPHLAGVADVLSDADIGIGHLEFPHTERGWVCSSMIPAPACPPQNIASVAEAGFDVLTMAHNHTFDQGPFGITDSIDAIEANGMQAAGAGLTIEEARRPAIVESGGLRIGVLSYNAVGPIESWATVSKAGCAPVRVRAHYELELATPGSYATEYTFPDPESLDEMRRDIEALKAEVDIVCVALHKGMIITRAALARYERPLSFAAIDAGADVVIGHHAHILRGVEVYRGKPIFHGVNHFITAYPDNADPQKPSGHKRTAPKNSPILAQNVPDGRVVNFPFSTEARMTIVARVVVDANGVREAGFIPAYIDEDAVTHIHGDDEMGRQIGQYMVDITREAGLEADISWDGAGFRFL